MKLKIRLTVLFVLLSLIPLFTVSFLGYSTQRQALIRQTAEQLLSLAVVQEQRVNEALDRYLEQVRLVTSRTQLRRSLHTFNQNGDQNELDRVQSIIADAADSVSNINDIHVLSTEGVVVASTTETAIGENRVDALFFEKGQKAHTLTDVFKDKGNVLKVRVVGPFMFEGEVIGVVEVIVSASPLVAVTEDYAGLGDTGEVMLVERNKSGDAVFLTPLRFDAAAALARAVPRDSTQFPVINAVLGIESILIEEDIIDYRGEPVIAVTRFIDPTGWGLVAKIDKKEALLPVTALFKSLASLISLSTFLIILMALLVTNTLTRPIKALTLFSQNLQSGNFSMRSEVSRKDEIGFLADTLNTMADRLEEFYKNLEKKVKKRTRELAAAKAKDEAILSSIGDGIVFTNLKRKVMFANKAMSGMLDMRPGEMIQKDWLELVNITDEKGKKIRPSDTPINKALTKKTSISTNSYYYSRNDESRFPVQITAAPVLVEKKLVGSVVAVRDITKETEIDKAKTEFVSLASHQLRTPLSTINWYAEMLIAGDAGKLKDEQKQYLEEIYTGNQRMVELVNALLNVSRLELGTFVIEPEPTDLKELLESVLKEVRPFVAKRKHTLTSEIDENMEVIPVDQKLLRMVFQNFTSNAIKYTPEGGNIHVTLKPAGKFIEFSVKDNGLGIPKSSQKKIFSKLFRADNVRETDTEGTGLGLYIVKSIIEHSGGKVWFESPVTDDAERPGTAFYATIPLRGMKKKVGTKSLG